MNLGERIVRHAWPVLALLAAGLIGSADREALAEGNTPLSQESLKAIRSQLKDAERAAAGAPPTPPTVRAERIEALRKAMGPDAPTPLPETTAEGYPFPIRVYTTAVEELKAGDPRGKITYPLHQGTIASTGTKAYFVLTEASDPEFAEEFGILHAPRLGGADVNKAVEADATLGKDGRWTFQKDPGRVPQDNGTSAPPSTISNESYSPLKEVKWKAKDDRTLIVNAPFVKWGEAPDQQLLVDQGDQDTRAEDRENPLDRYLGGQALQIWVDKDKDDCPMTPPWEPCGWVTMKLHKTIHDPDVYPYVTVFSASQARIAAKLGVPHTPKLAQAGRSSASPALGVETGPAHNAGVSAIVEFRNGVKMPSGGLAGFQPGVISYGVPKWSTYSPILHVIWAFFDCGGSQEAPPAGQAGSLPGTAPTEKSVAIPSPGPAPDAKDYLDAACPKYVKEVLGKGKIVELSRLFELWEARKLELSESLPLPGFESKMHLVVDAPAPVAVVWR